MSFKSFSPVSKIDLKYIYTLLMLNQFLLNFDVHNCEMVLFHLHLGCKGI